MRHFTDNEMLNYLLGLRLRALDERLGVITLDALIDQRRRLQEEMERAFTQGAYITIPQGSPDAKPA